jgi:hypothetical protein
MGSPLGEVNGRLPGKWRQGCSASSGSVKARIEAALRDAIGPIGGEWTDFNGITPP